MNNYHTPSISRTPARGDIYYVTGNPEKEPVGTEIWPDRAGLVVSNDAGNRHSGFVEIVYLSTSPRKVPSPTHVKVISGKKIATALCEQVHTVDDSRLSAFIGHATDEEMQNVSEAILFGLGINHGTSPQGIFHKWERMVRACGLEEAYWQEHEKSFDEIKD